jgi:hypothetical protein
LYHQTTGSLVAKGTLPASGGTLQIINQPVGVYVLQIEMDADADTFETHRVILKN